MPCYGIQANILVIRVARRWGSFFIEEFPSGRFSFLPTGLARDVSYTSGRARRALFRSCDVPSRYHAKRKAAHARARDRARMQNVCLRGIRKLKVCYYAGVHCFTNPSTSLHDISSLRSGLCSGSTGLGCCSTRRLLRWIDKEFIRYKRESMVHWVLPDGHHGRRWCAPAIYR